MTHPDSRFDLFKPILLIGLMTFALGFAGVLALAWPGAASTATGTELAAAMQVAAPPQS